MAYCMRYKCALFPSAYEDEDLRDIRASMERLLQEEGDLIRSSPEVGSGDFNGNPPESEDQEFFNRIAAEIDQDNNQMAVDDDDDNDDDDGDDDDDDDDDGVEEDEEEEGEEEEDDDEDEDEECSNGSPGDEEPGELLTNGVGVENHSNNGHLNEEWHSGWRNAGVLIFIFFEFLNAIIIHY